MQPVCTLHAAWHHAGMMPTQPSNPNVRCQKSNVLACVDVQFSSGPLYAYKGHMPGPLFVELISKRPLGCPISLAVMVQCINSVQRQVKWGGLNHTVLAWDSLFALASSVLFGRAASPSPTCALLSSASRSLGRYTAVPNTNFCHRAELASSIEPPT